MFAIGLLVLARPAALIDGMARFLEWQLRFVRQPGYRLLVRLVGWLLVANGLLWAVSLLLGRPPLPL